MVFAVSLSQDFLLAGDDVTRPSAALRRAGDQLTLDIGNE
jgi:hypothetical protein